MDSGAFKVAVPPVAIAPYLDDEELAREMRGGILDKIVAPLRKILR